MAWINGQIFPITCYGLCLFLFRNIFNTIGRVEIFYKKKLIFYQHSLYLSSHTTANEKRYFEKFTYRTPIKSIRLQKLESSLLSKHFCNDFLLKIDYYNPRFILQNWKIFQQNKEYSGFIQKLSNASLYSFYRLMTFVH